MTSLDLLLERPSPSLRSLPLLRVNGFIASFPEGGFTACAGGGVSGGAEAEVMAPRPMEVGLRVWAAWITITWVERSTTAAEPGGKFPRESLRPLTFENHKEEGPGA